MMNLEALLSLANLFVANNPATEASARLCLTDACELVTMDAEVPEQHGPGEALEMARDRALRSLAYSVGVLHPAYRAASFDGAYFFYREHAGRTELCVMTDTPCQFMVCGDCERSRLGAVGVTSYRWPVVDDFEASATMLGTLEALATEAR